MSNHDAKALTSNRSPSTSRTLVHRTGISIAAIDISPYRTHAVLAGREILKTVQVSGAQCTEDFNLRSSIIAYASTHDTSRDAVSAQHKDQLAVNDVKWSHGRYDSTIATAAANGRIVLYDVNRASVELARLHQHTRQVHRLAFNPHQGSLLLSGSQDATVRMWDLRDLAGERSVMTCRSARVFSGNNEGIRDLRWSPTDGVMFAAATDTGVIQRWDFRNEKAPSLRINAHDKTCHSIDWHPDGKYLASAGADRNVKIWDFKSMDRRMKTSRQFRAPQPVFNVRWRPVGSVSGSVGFTNHQSTQLATSYHQNDPRVHIWDLRRPYMPFLELDRYDTGPADMLWKSEDLLWSASMAGIFTQSDMNFAMTSLERQNVNIVGSGSDGELCFASKERVRRRSSLLEIPAQFLRRNNTEGSSSEQLGSSQSATDGSFEEPASISSSLKNRRRVPGNLPYLSSTPPTANNSLFNMSFEEIIKSEEKAFPSQIIAFGSVFGVFDIEAFKYLAKHYRPLLPTIGSNDGRNDIYDSIMVRFEHNAVTAASAAQYRVAQTWRILGLAIMKELNERAEVVLQSQKADSTPLDTNLLPGHKYPIGSQDKQGDRSYTISISDSPSNMPTPIAKPVQGLQNVPAVAGGMLASREENIAHLSDRLWKSKRHPTQPLSNPSKYQVSTSAPAFVDLPGILPKTLKDDNLMPAKQLPEEGFADVDQQMHERRAAVTNYRAKPREILRLEEPAVSPRNLNVMSRLHRHDSAESFQMFSASTDSDQHSMMLAGSFGGSDNSNLSDPPTGSWDSSPEKHFIHRQPQESAGRLLDYAVGVQSSSEESSPYVDHQVQNHRLSLIEGSSLRRSDQSSPPIIHVRKHRSPRRSLNARHPDAESGDDPFYLRITSHERSKFVPWRAATLVQQVIDYHLHALSDTQLPALLILYLTPLFPSLFDRQHTTSILLSYHHQLESLNLFVSAAQLRQHCYPGYPEIWQRGISNNRAGGWYCFTCKKAVKGDQRGFCKRCKHHWGTCPICDTTRDPLPFTGHLTLDDGSKEEVEATGLWAWCQGCGHGGHSSCLRMWWSDVPRSEGACPARGCLHDCMPGLRRDERIKARDGLRLQAKLSRGGVRSDRWVVPESWAVIRTRGMVGRRRGKWKDGVGGGVGVGGLGRRVGDGGNLVGAAGAGLAVGTRAVGEKRVRLVVPDGKERARGGRNGDAGRVRTRSE